MEIKRLFDCIEYQLQNNPLDDSLANKINGQWIKYSTAEIQKTVNDLSLGLLATGLKKGDKIGIISFSRPEWAMADLAISQIGAISVPMYPNSTADDYAFIIEDAEVKLIFCGEEEIYNKVKSIESKYPHDVKLFNFNQNEKGIYWKELFKDSKSESLEELQSLRNSVKTEDLATIIYTSGTTGTPKGVMLSHKNILANSQSVADVFPIKEGKIRTLSFLPLCHIFERTALYTYMQIGISMYYAESMDTIGENLKEVKPDFFATVPRLLEKVYDKIYAKGLELKGIKRRLFFWALDLGDRYEPNLTYSWWYNLQLFIANKIIFNKWREALGGNIKFIVSGAAALQPRLSRVFWAAKVHVLEAYGLTETSPGVSLTRDEPENVRIGCVGPLLPRVEVKIAEDGEILVKGPNVMMGYYKRQDATDEVIDSEGWFHTGDIGQMIENKFLKITDRKKEMFKTSGGKYIAPQMVENKFKESMLIEQVMVVGESQKFPAALLVPNFDNLREWANKKRLVYTTDFEMISNEKVIKKYDKELAKLNAGFAQYEQIKRYHLIEKQWTIDGGELTPTLKLKRKVILNKYSEQILKFYTE